MVFPIIGNSFQGVQHLTKRGGWGGGRKGGGGDRRKKYFSFKKGVGRNGGKGGFQGGFWFGCGLDGGRKRGYIVLSLICFTFPLFFSPSQVVFRCGVEGVNVDRTWEGRECWGGWWARA